MIFTIMRYCLMVQIAIVAFSFCLLYSANGKSIAVAESVVLSSFDQNVKGKRILPGVATFKEGITHLGQKNVSTSNGESKEAVASKLERKARVLHDLVGSKKEVRCALYKAVKQLQQLKIRKEEWLDLEKERDRMHLECRIQYAQLKEWYSQLDSSRLGSVEKRKEKQQIESSMDYYKSLIASLEKHGTGFEYLRYYYHTVHKFDDEEKVLRVRISELQKHLSFLGA